MCLAIPLKVTAIENEMGTVEVDGVVRKASLILLEDVNVGDYVIVHAGFAINTIDEKAALETIEELRNIADSMDNPE